MFKLTKEMCAIFEELKVAFTTAPEAYIAYQQDDWVEWLPLAKFAYNNSWQSTTGELPFYLLIGQNP